MNWRRYEQEIVDKLFMGVQYVYSADVAGDVAEFGTFSGLTALVLANAIAGSDEHLSLPTRPPKRLHLFDSFQGLPPLESEVDRDCAHGQTGVWRPGVLKGISIEQLLNRCSPPLARERIDVYDGWFSDTVKQIPEGTVFSLLHIDCDLYQSTMDVLVPLFERRMVSPGAVLFFDDWNCNRASPDHGERKAWAECVERFNIKYSDGGDYGIVSHKLIVHDY